MNDRRNPKSGDRDRRLAAALRDNLRRRKAQARQLDESPDDAKPKDGDQP